MKELLYKAFGRSSLVFDYSFRFLSKNNKNKEMIDKTGILFKNPERPRILFKDSECLFVEYNKLSHSFWRAQELSLLSNHKDFIKFPLLDFGCGDGSFASALYEKIDYGVDCNPEALSIANGYGIYNKLIQNTSVKIPLESNIVSSVVSNSALEHIIEIDKILSEVYRILRDDGNFIFTTPVSNFKKHLEKYFGKSESERINIEYCHYNLMTDHEWEKKLNAHSFSIVKIIEYQPEWFTFWYRMLRLLGSRGLGRYIPRLKQTAWNLLNKWMISMVKESVFNTKEGANILVIAKKLKKPPS